MYMGTDCSSVMYNVQEWKQAIQPLISFFAFRIRYFVCHFVCFFLLGFCPFVLVQMQITTKPLDLFTT